MSPKTFDIAYLADNLADFLSDIQKNVEVTLTYQGVPWAILPLSSEKKAGVGLNNDLAPRVAGFWQGQVKIADDFDETTGEVIAAFYGDE